MLDLGRRNAGRHGAHTAGDVKADAAGGNDAALLRVERRHAADRKAVAPVRVRHDVTRLDDAGERSNTRCLLGHLVVHGPDQGLVGIEDDRHSHCPCGLNAPRHIIQLREIARVHPRLS